MAESNLQDTALDNSPMEGHITDDAIAAAQAMVGSYLRPEGPFIQDVTVDTICTYCNGIGDLNPLFRDAEYGRRSRHASLVAHPTLPSNTPSSDWRIGPQS